MQHNPNAPYLFLLFLLVVIFLLLCLSAMGKLPSLEPGPSVRLFPGAEPIKGWESPAWPKLTFSRLF